jgi:hypothetical protein
VCSHFAVLYSHSKAFVIYFWVREIHLKKECDFLETFIESVKKQADELLSCMRAVFTAEKKRLGYVNKDFALISNMSEDAIKLLLSEKSKNPSYISVVSLATSLGLDLNELAGYTPPQKTDTSVVTIKEDCYVEEITRLCDKRVEDVKSMCELRIADINAMWEARYNDLKEMTTK